MVLGSRRTDISRWRRLEALVVAQEETETKTGVVKGSSRATASSPVTVV